MYIQSLNNTTISKVAIHEVESYISPSELEDMMTMFNNLQATFDLLTTYIQAADYANEQLALNSTENIDASTLRNPIERRISDYGPYHANIGDTPQESVAKTHNGLSKAFEEFHVNPTASTVGNLDFKLVGGTRVFELTHAQLTAINNVTNGLPQNTPGSGTPFQVCIDQELFKKFLGKYVVYGHNRHPAPTHVIFSLQHIVTPAVLRETVRAYRNAERALNELKRATQTSNTPQARIRLAAFQQHVTDMYNYYDKMAKDFVVAHELTHLHQYLYSGLHDSVVDQNGEIRFNATVPGLNDVLERQANDVAIHGMLGAWYKNTSDPEEIGKVLSMVTKHPVFSSNVGTQDDYSAYYQTEVAKLADQVDLYRRADDLYRSNYSASSRPLATTITESDYVIERIRNIVVQEHLPCIEVNPNNNYIQWNSNGQIIKPEIAWDLTGDYAGQEHTGRFGLWLGAFMKLAPVVDYIIMEDHELLTYFQNNIWKKISSLLSSTI